MKVARTIGIVCHFPPPPGGMPGQALALSVNLRKEGWNVLEIRTNLKGGVFLSALDSTRFLRTLVRFPVFLARLAAALPKVDILHILSCCGLTFFLFTMPAILMGRLLHRKIVLHYHGGEARAFFRRWRPIIRAVVAQADLIVVPSAFLQEIFRQELGFEVTIIANVCDFGRFKQSAPREVAPRFIAARHLEKIYNVACVIRAFAIVKKKYENAHLVIAGDGPEQGNLKRVAEELGVCGSVRFLGYVDNLEMPDIYREASIFLNGSAVDNAPIAILEAFAAGLPVVSTCAGGIPYVVDDGRTGLLVDLDDHEAMAQKVFLLLDNPQLAQRLVGKAQLELKKYSWPEVFRRLMDAYTDLQIV